MRDRIPEIIRKGGGSPDIVILDDADHWEALLAKMREETEEVAEASLANQLSELADLFEVLRALGSVAGFSLAEIQGYADAKRLERGGFETRVWLVT